MYYYTIFLKYYTVFSSDTASPNIITLGFFFSAEMDVQIFHKDPHHSFRKKLHAEIIRSNTELFNTVWEEEKVAQKVARSNIIVQSVPEQSLHSRKALSPQTLQMQGRQTRHSLFLTELGVEWSNIEWSMLSCQTSHRAVQFCRLGSCSTLKFTRVDQKQGSSSHPRYKDFFLFNYPWRRLQFSQHGHTLSPSRCKHAKKMSANEENRQFPL